MASPGSRQLVSRSMCGSSRPAATRASRRSSIPVAPRRLASSGKTSRPYRRAPGARPKSERVGNSVGALGSLLAKETTVPSARDALDRGAERRAADALDDHVELRPLGRELVDDLVGAEVGEAAGALGAGRDGGHVGAADVGELHGEAADAAARAGDQHAPRDRGAADVEGQQGGDPGDRERRGLREAHLVGQDRDGVASGRRRAAPTPGCGGPRRGLPRAARCRRRPARRTVPARSQPVRLPGGLLASALTSPRFSEIASTATSASLGSGSGSGASASSTPGSAEEVSRASIGVTLPIGVRRPAVRESASWTRTPTRGPWPRATRSAAAPSRTRGCRRWRRARGRRGARGPRRTAGCARRCSATATGSCTPRPSGG